MLELVDALAEQTALIVGDIMLDEYIWGDMTRISPEAPVPVVRTRQRTYRPGGAANVAANVAALGGIPFLAGIIGADEFADPLREAFAQAQVQWTAGILQTPDRATTVKTRIVAQQQQVLRLDKETSAPLTRAQEEALLDWCATQMRTARVCILSDYAKGVISPRLAQAVIQRAHEQQLPIVADPKGRDFAKYNGATVVTPNLAEATLAASSASSPSDLDDSARQLLEIIGGANLLLTRGAEGMTLYAPNASAVHIPAHTRAVYDVSGAGDTVVAILALALAAGADVTQAAQLANFGAGLVIGKFGTATISRAELRQGIAQL